MSSMDSIPEENEHTLADLAASVTLRAMGIQTDTDPGKITYHTVKKAAQDAARLAVHFVTEVEDFGKFLEKRGAIPAADKGGE